MSAGEAEYKIFSASQARPALLQAPFLGVQTKLLGDGRNELSAFDAIRLSFAGESARSADRIKLSYAQRAVAAGMEPSLVRNHTGWEQGLDGRWRFEIDDSAATLTYGPDSTTNPEAYLDWAEEAAAREGGVPLAQVLRHPALYQAYPQLMAYRVKVRPRNELKGSAALDRDGREILMVDPYELPVRKDGINPGLSVLLHEIQHAIQDIEGFAQGGQPDSLGHVLDDASFAALADRHDSLLATPEAQANAQRFDELRGEWGGRDDVPDEVARELEQLRNAAVARELATLQARGLRLHKNRTTFGGTHYRREELMDGYHRLAGEVEARNVQRRASFTARDRKVCPVETTEDVPREDQLLVDREGNFFGAPVGDQALQLSHIDTLNGCVVNATRGGRLIQQVATEMLDLLSDAGLPYGWMDGGCRIFAEALRDWSDGKILLGVTSADGKTASHVVGVLALNEQPEGATALIDADGLSSPDVMLEKLNWLEHSPGEKVIGIGDLADQLAQSLPIEEAVVDQAVQSLEVGLGTFSQWAKGLQSELTADLEVGLQGESHEIDKAGMASFVTPGGP